MSTFFTSKCTLHLCHHPRQRHQRAMHHTRIHYGSFSSPSWHRCPPRTMWPPRGTPDTPAALQPRQTQRRSVRTRRGPWLSDAPDPCLLDIAACGGSRAGVDEAVAPGGHARVDVEAKPRHKSSSARPRRWSGMEYKLEELSNNN
jgi:hypothetical protein